MQNTEELKRKLGTFFSSQRLAVLATCEGVKPYTSLMSVAVTDDLGQVLFITEEKSRKCINMDNIPDVALLFDDRSSSEERDISEGLAVTALGKATRVPADEKQWFLEIYEAKHPNLKSFARSPSAVLFKVAVESWVIVSKFQNVVELKMAR